MKPLQSTLRGLVTHSRSAHALAAGALLSSVPAAAQGAEEPRASRVEAEQPSEVVALPLISRSEETDWALGVAGIYLFPGTGDGPRSNVNASATVSIRKQFIGNVQAYGYLLDDSLRLRFNGLGFLWPTQFFSQEDLELEPEDYSFAGGSVEVSVTARAAGRLFVGPSFLLATQSNDVPEGGLMEASSLRSLSGYTVSGPGLSVSYDTRDLPFGASRGVFAGADAYWLFGADGESKTFLQYRGYGRTYFSDASATNVFALGAEVKGVAGNPPFSMMPTTDGTTIIRGIQRARYYDQHVAMAQAEYRRYLGKLGPTGPWALTAFAEVGQFFEALSSLGERDLVTSLGAGVRYLLVPKERLALRFDFSYVDGGMGFIINAAEAF